MKFQFNNKNTFCITIENNEVSEERYKRMMERFEYFGMSVCKWPASTPNTLTDNFSDYLNKNQMACSQSHVNIWKHMINNNIEYAFILEDDACFDKNWVEKLSEIENSLCENDWHMIMLNSSESTSELNKWVIAIEQYMCAGYIISLQCVRELMNIYKDCFHSSDWMTTRIQYLNKSYCYFPWLIIQEGKNSLIDPSDEHINADRNKVLQLLRQYNYDIKNYI